MFPVINPAQIGASSGMKGKKDDSSIRILKPFDLKESECFLTSVNTLRQNLVKGKHSRKCVHFLRIKPELIHLLDLTEIIEKHTFVGIVDLPRSLSLIQYSTKLYLVNHGSLAYILIPSHVHTRNNARCFAAKNCSISWDYANLGTSAI
jgi:DNA mismatch repair protein MLH1